VAGELLTLGGWAAGLAPPLAHVAYAAWVRRRFPQVGDVIQHRGARLHYMRCGEGPTVVLVHGANGTWNDFPPELITDLARDHTVVAVDRPGHGWSQAPRGRLGLAENADALVGLLRLQGAHGVTLVGHSYGAAVAMHTALAAPELVRHVVAVAPCTTTDSRNLRYVRAPIVGGPLGRLVFQYLALALRPFGIPLRADAWHPDPAPRHGGASRAFAYVPSQIHASARNFRALASDMDWLEARLARFPAMLTVLAGAEDRVTPPELHVEWLRGVLPSARVEVVPDVGHWLVRVHPERVADAVRAERASPGRGPDGR